MKIAQPFFLGNHTVAPGVPPIFIFECGINHNGRLDVANVLVNQAYTSGAQVVKFQHHLPDREMLPGHPLWDVLSETALTIADLAQLKDYAESLGLVFLCTPFCREAADQLESLGVEAFKMGSGELNNLPLQRHVAMKGKPMLISTGMSSLDEVRMTLKQVTEINPRVVLLNCCSVYPAIPYQARLPRIYRLAELWGGAIGQSDHTPTIATCLGAIARGAVIIEKHVTLDRDMPGPDHAGSVLPTEFAQMVQLGHQVWEGCQEQWSDLDQVLEAEQPVRGWANHCLLARHALPAGHVVAWEDLDTRRPANAGLPASDALAVVGRALVRPLIQGQLFQFGDFA